MRRARRFDIWDDVMRTATRLSITHPSVLARLLSSARPSFEPMWVEYSPAAYLDEAGVVLEGSPPPTKSGFVIERLAGPRHLYRATSVGFEGAELVLLPFSYLFSPDAPLDEADREGEREISMMLGMPAELLGSTLIGQGFASTTEGLFDKCGISQAEMPHFLELDEPFEQAAKACREILPHAAFDWTPVVGRLYRNAMAGPPLERAKTAYKAMRELIGEFVGTWATLVSILALMNDREVTNGGPPRRAGGRRLVGTRLVPYVDTQPVTLRLAPRDVMVRKIRETTARLPPRRHDVAGHWSLSSKRGDAACEHEWIPLSDNHQSCGLCRGFRWWTAAHERGPPCQ
jgi:hypothetical protein